GPGTAMTRGFWARTSAIARPCVRSPHRMRLVDDSSGSTATFVRPPAHPARGAGWGRDGRSERGRQAERVGHAGFVAVHIHLVATRLLVLAEVGLQQVACAEAQ